MVIESLNNPLSFALIRRFHHVSRPSTARRHLAAATTEEKAARHQQWRQQHDGGTRGSGADRNHPLWRRWTEVEADNRAGRGRISEHKCTATVRTVNPTATLSNIVARRSLHGHATTRRRTDVCQRTSHHTADDLACKFKLEIAFERRFRFVD